VRAARPLALCADVGEEEALVLAREGGTQAVLEEARAADDDGPAVEVVEHVRQPAQDVRREERALEELDDVRVVQPHAIGVHVLPAVDVLEVVVMDEVEDAVGGDVPAPGEPDVASISLYSGERATIREARKSPAAFPPRRPWLRGG